MGDLDDLRRRLRRRLRPPAGDGAGFLPAPDPAAQPPAPGAPSMFEPPPPRAVRGQAPLAPLPSPVADPGPAGGDFLPGLEAPAARRVAAADDSFLPGPAVADLPFEPLATALPGAEVDGPWGPCWRLTGPAAAWLGPRYCAEVPATAAPRSPSSRARQLAALPPGQRLYLDLETCGLRDAPLFLCGLAFEDGDGIQLELLLARTRAEEPAVIAAAAARLAAAHTLLTFNGTGFDVPFLQARAAYFGQPLTWPAEHLDLLPTCRRRYGKTFGDCRLVTLERHVVGRRRLDDVPSAAIPKQYEQFETTGNGALLRPIVHHNALDLLACASLLSALATGRG